MSDDLLNLPWKAHFINRYVRTTLKELLQNEGAELIRLIRKITSELTPLEIRESLKGADIRSDFPLISVSPQPSVSSVTENETTPSQEHVDERDTASKAPNIPMVRVTDLIQSGLISLPLKLEK